MAGSTLVKGAKEPRGWGMATKEEQAGLAVKNGFYLSAVAFLVIFALGGCYGSRYVKGASAPGVVLPVSTKVAVLPLVSENKFAGKTAADMVMTYLVEAGLVVVEREQVESVIKEYNLSTTGLLNRVQTVELGKILGVDAFIVGALPKYQDNIHPFDGKHGSVGISIRMYETETGKIIWSASGSKTIGGFPDSASAQVNLNKLMKEMFRTFPGVSH